MPPTDNGSRRSRRFLDLLLVFGLALLYGLITRLAFGGGVLMGLLGAKQYLPIVSYAYLFLMPMGFGALTTFLGYRYFGRHTFWIYGAPILVVLFGVVAAWLLQMEATFCIILALPMLIPLALLGGGIMSMILKKHDGRLQVTFLVLLPYLVAPAESFWQHPAELVTIENVVHIRASPEQIWTQIVSVPAIPKEMLPHKLIYWLDFPRPIAATLEGTGVGSRRHATFERGVSFYEGVTVWEPPQRLSFSIKADAGFIPHTAFDQHIIVGGRFYNVLTGMYVIKPLADGSCNLHLSSTHRLSTPFNLYASWWSEWGMHQIQDSILSVIHQRAEQAARQATPAAPQ